MTCVWKTAAHFRQDLTDSIYFHWIKNYEEYKPFMTDKLQWTPMNSRPKLNIHKAFIWLSVVLSIYIVCPLRLQFICYSVSVRLKVKVHKTFLWFTRQCIRRLIYIQFRCYVHWANDRNFKRPNLCITSTTLV